jgi:hypothetical protein
MWDRIDSLLEHAPEARLHLHRVELLEARRRRAAGLPVGAALEAEEREALLREMAVVLMKGPEVALDYPGARLRRFGDLDLLVADPRRAQAALLAGGFVEVGEPSVFEGIHHLRPLWWPGLPLCVEIHERAHWPDGLPAPPTEELLASAVPSRLGVAGIGTLEPAAHAIALAAHDWSHQPLGRLGNLIDVATALRRTTDAETDALARAWGCRRLWRTSRRAVGRLLEGDRRSAAVALWGRHLPALRERTVFEWHLHRLLAPVWGLPAPHATTGALASLAADGRPLPGEAASTKLRRTAFALREAGRPRSVHDLALEERGGGPTG